MDSSKHPSPPVRSTKAFGVLLASQILLILLPPLLQKFDSSWIITLCLVFVIFASIYIVATTRRRLYFGIILAVLSLGSLFTNSQVSHDNVELISLGMATLFFMFMGWELATHMTLHNKFDLNMILAAITGYIFIGIIGGHLVQFVEILIPGSFNIPENANDYIFVYYAFVATTTLGFGDIIPQNDLARSITILLSVSGQIYLAVIIALIVGRYAASR